MSEGSNTLRDVRRVHKTTQCNVACRNVSFALYMSMHRDKMNISTSHTQRLTFYSIKFLSMYLINNLVTENTLCLVGVNNKHINLSCNVDRKKCCWLGNAVTPPPITKFFPFHTFYEGVLISS